MPESSYLQVPGDDINTIDYTKHTIQEPPWLPLISFAAGCLVTYLIATYASVSGAAHASGNLEEPFPQFAPEIFQAKPALMEAPSEENQRFWDALVPIGRGFVNVSSPEVYRLLRGIPTESGVDRYSVAMYHQLHCLGLVRAHFWKLIADMSEPSWTDAVREEAVQHMLRDRHPQHCFAYLVQSILCSADLTIEWARHREGVSGDEVDGWGVPHQCKDPEAIRSWMEENHGPVVQGHNYSSRRLR
ncbi:hypothetical protein PG994_005179 [Apiospora phragmitis]|uniref:Uncharacterized protein n=1 Tax=Apiospora phragmitis TaxID=2905665 RepID=A0ABR1VSP9_9PEZI